MKRTDTKQRKEATVLYTRYQRVETAAAWIALWGSIGLWGYVLFRSELPGAIIRLIVRLLQK